MPHEGQFHGSGLRTMLKLYKFSCGMRCLVVPKKRTTWPLLFANKACPHKASAHALSIRTTPSVSDYQFLVYEDA